MTFTYNEFNLLNKDLNFCSTPGKHNKFKYTRDEPLAKKDATLNTRLPMKDVIQLTKSSSEKKWIPEETHHTVKTFIKAFNKELEIEEKFEKETLKSDLTKNEPDALPQLSQRDEIITTKADKGGAVVVIDVDGYIRESNRQLNNRPI